MSCLSSPRIAKHLEQFAPLHRHRLRHRQDQLQPARRCHEGQRDARVAARRLDDHGLFVDATALDRVVDHRKTNPVLYARERIEKFELQQDLRLGAVSGGRAVEADEGRVADGFGDIVIDACHVVEEGCR